jgi:hypothetical protein
MLCASMVVAELHELPSMTGSGNEQVFSEFGLALSQVTRPIDTRNISFTGPDTSNSKTSPHESEDLTRIIPGLYLGGQGHVSFKYYG